MGARILQIMDQVILSLHVIYHVEKTVKPLKSGENVVTSEHNNNGPQKRSGGDRERKYHLEHAQKGGSEAGMKRVVSNMAGVVLEFLVKQGEEISIDQDVVMLESMKMQIPVQSTVAGTVKAIRVNEGDFVDDGDILLEVE